MPAATQAKAPPHRFGVNADPHEMAERSIAAREAKRASGELLTSDRLRRLSLTEWDTHYTSRAFPGIWGRHFNSQQRLYSRHYKAITSDAPQYRTLCWRAAALSTTLAMLEAGQAPQADRIRVDQRLVECIGQLQRYTESEKHESVIIDATKERVLSLVIAVADHVLADEAKPALFGALRRVIAGGELDPSRAISMLSQVVQAAPGAVIEHVPTPPGDAVDVLSEAIETEPPAMPEDGDGETDGTHRTQAPRQG